MTIPSPGDFSPATIIVTAIVFLSGFTLGLLVSHTERRR